MALSAKLELRQGQQLVMTPQLQQAIRLLQLSNMELVEFVDAEIERNPLLERDESPEDARGTDAAEEREPVAAATSEGGATDDWLDLERPGSDAAASLDTDIDNVFPDTPSMDMGGGPSDSGWASLTQRTHNLDLGDSSLEDYI